MQSISSNLAQAAPGIAVHLINEHTHHFVPEELPWQIMIFTLVGVAAGPSSAEEWKCLPSKKESCTRGGKSTRIGSYEPLFLIVKCLAISKEE